MKIRWKSNYKCQYIYIYIYIICRYIYLCVCVCIYIYIQGMFKNIKALPRFKICRTFSFVFVSSARELKRKSDLVFLVSLEVAVRCYDKIFNTGS